MHYDKRTNPVLNHQVIMGGGRVFMVPTDEVAPGGLYPGRRGDGQNLISMWKESMKDNNGRFGESFPVMFRSDAVTTYTGYFSTRFCC